VEKSGPGPALTRRRTYPHVDNLSTALKPYSIKGFRDRTNFLWKTLNAYSIKGFRTFPQFYPQAKGRVIHISTVKVIYSLCITSTILLLQGFPHFYYLWITYTQPVDNSKDKKIM